MNWKYSSVGVQSMSRALALTGKAEQVLARCGPQTRAALDKPHLESWHDGSVVVDLSLAIQAELGDAAVDEVYYQAVKRNLGPVMEPFLKVMLMLGGRKPETVLSKMNASLASIMKGVRTEWTPTGPKAGVLTVIHEDEVKPVSFFAWGGSLRYSFDLVGVKGRVTPRMPSPDNKRFTFDLSWD
jgi:hypothetical protein